MPAREPSTRVPRLPRLLGVVDHGLCLRLALDPVRVAAEAVEAGLPFLWLRSRGLPPAELLTLAQPLAACARDAGIPLVLSGPPRSTAPAAPASAGLPDSVAVASRLGVGLHLRAGLPAPCDVRGSLGDGLIGVSAHDATELGAAATADYATLSPLRESTSKPGYGGHRPPSALRRLAAQSAVPVFALGGVRPEDAALLDAFHGLAVMGPLHGLTGQPPRDVVAGFLEAIAGAPASH